MPPTTRSQRRTSSLFSELPFHERFFTMATGSEATTPLVIDDITNPYALQIGLTSKAGLSLFAATTKGLADKEKLDLLVAKAALFKQEIDCAAADYCWGMVCSRINKDAGTAVNLLEDYKDLKF